MDTGDLSEEAYMAIMVESEKFNHDLTLQFGLLSYCCYDENYFVENSIILIHEMKQYDEIDLETMFFGTPSPKDEFHKTLEKILNNIKEVKEIPIEKRNYD